MSIFSSAYALTGVAPATGRHQQIDDAESWRRTSPAVGVDLQDDDTVTFQRLSDVDTEQCYLPWCVNDIRDIVYMGDPAHDHVGTFKRIETGSRTVDGTMVERDVIVMAIEQADTDDDRFPEDITGEAHVYFRIGEDQGNTAYVLLTAEALLELGNMSIALAQVMFATRGLVNPNRVTEEQLRAGRESRDKRWAERDAEEAAEEARVAELRDSSLARAYELGRRIGASWRCPRAWGAVIGVFTGHRKGFKLGLQIGIEVYRGRGTK